MRTSHFPPERRREIAQRAACTRWQRVHAREAAVTSPLLPPRCLVCRQLIGFHAQDEPAVLKGMGWVCSTCVRSAVLPLIETPSLGRVIHEQRP